MCFRIRIEGSDEVRQKQVGSTGMNDATTTLLRGLLLPESAARGYLDKWCRQTDLDAVDSATHPLLPMLYRRLGDLQMPPWETERLRGVYRKTWYRNQRHVAAVNRAIETLTGIEVEATVVGGFALALGPYGDLGLRMVEAAQVVVQPDSFRTAIEELCDAGFEVGGRNRIIGYGLPVRMIHEGGGQIDFRDCVYGPGWPGVPERLLWSRRIPVAIDGIPQRTLAPTDSIAAAAAFGLTSRYPTHQWLVDLAVITRQSQPSIRWKDLIHHYGNTPLSVPIREALGVGEAVLRGGLGPEVAALISEMNPSPRQHLRFWFHRRGRRLARLPGWYLRGAKSASRKDPVGFTRFVKEVYNVGSIAELLGKGLRKLRRAHR